jgi:hypothetical protein
MQLKSWLGAGVLAAAAAFVSAPVSAQCSLVAATIGPANTPEKRVVRPSEASPASPSPVLKRLAALIDLAQNGARCDRRDCPQR